MEKKWILVGENIPQLSPRYKNFSEDVYVKFADGMIGIGYFSYREHCWYSCESKPYEDNVIEWTTM